MCTGDIIQGLERCEATGAEADAIARQGFLEWVFVQPELVTGPMISEALSQPELQNPESAAAKAFVAVLEQALDMPMQRPSRRYGRRGRLHS